MLWRRTLHVGVNETNGENTNIALKRSENKTVARTCDKLLKSVVVLIDFAGKRFQPFDCTSQRGEPHPLLLWHWGYVNASEADQNVSLHKKSI